MNYQPGRFPWHEKLSVRGIEYGLTWWGDKTAAPLVLLHGFMDCSATWQFLVHCLPHTWSLVAPDWRGFGASLLGSGRLLVSGLSLRIWSSCCRYWYRAIRRASSVTAWEPTLRRSMRESGRPD